MRFYPNGEQGMRALWFWELSDAHSEKQKTDAKISICYKSGEVELVKKSNNLGK